jgi:ElaA protein
VKPAVRFELRAFDDLSPRELHDALALRQRVFVVEQACLYQDVDGKDPNALHLLGRDETSALVAYARILPPGARFDVAAIGRVVVAPEHRGQGLARTLMLEAIRIARDHHGPRVALSAQAHLEAFYASLGFVRVGDVYDEDGIPHVDMRR